MYLTNFPTGKAIVILLNTFPVIVIKNIKEMIEAAFNLDSINSGGAKNWGLGA